MAGQIRAEETAGLSGGDGRSEKTRRLVKSVPDGLSEQIQTNETAARRITVGNKALEAVRIVTHVFGTIECHCLLKADLMHLPPGLFSSLVNPL